MGPVDVVLCRAIAWQAAGLFYDCLARHPRLCLYQYITTTLVDGRNDRGGYRGY